MMADRASVLRRLKTARGQLDGVIRMVEEDEYCIDISNQILAAKALLNKANLEVLRAHMENCIMDAARSGSDKQRKAKIQEMSALLEKLTK